MKNNDDIDKSFLHYSANMDTNMSLPQHYFHANNELSSVAILIHLDITFGESKTALLKLTSKENADRKIENLKA